MSVSTMPTWWADRRPAPKVSRSSLRVTRPVYRKLRGLAAAVAVLAVSAVGVALPMSTAQTPIAQRTLEAEHIQNLALTWQDSHPAQPVFQPQLDRMLPITDRATGVPCVPGAASSPGSSC